MTSAQPSDASQSMNSRTGTFALIATDPGSLEEAKTYKKLFSKPYQSCLGDVTQFNVSHTLVRGAIAEGLYRKKIPLPTALIVPAPGCDRGVPATAGPSAARR